MTRLLCGIAISLSFALLFLIPVTANSLVAAQQGTVTASATATGTPQVSATVTATEPSRLATQTSTSTEQIKSETQTATPTASSALPIFTPTTTPSLPVFASPTASLVFIPTTQQAAVTLGTPPGAETATLVPLPEVTFIFPQATPTDHLLAVSRHPAEPALQKQARSQFWQRVFRLWPLFVVLVFWGLLVIWYILVQARLPED